MWLKHCFQKNYNFKRLNYIFPIILEISLNYVFNSRDTGLLLNTVYGCSLQKCCHKNFRRFNLYMTFIEEIMQKHFINTLTMHLMCKNVQFVSHLLSQPANIVASFSLVREIWAKQYHLDQDFLQNYYLLIYLFKIIPGNLT